VFYLKTQSFTIHTQVFQVTSFGFVNKPSPASENLSLCKEKFLVKGLDTGWTVWGSNSSGHEIFCTCKDWPWRPLSLLYNEYHVSPRGKMDLYSPVGLHGLF